MQRFNPKHRWLWLLWLLVACVPSQTPSAASFSALAVSERGEIAFVLRGQAWLARAPEFKPAKLAHAANASSVAWRSYGGVPEVWLAMPGAGLVSKASGVPANVSVPGRPFLLTSRCIVTLEGIVYSSEGKLPQLLNFVPRRASENAAGLAVLIGNQVVWVDCDRGPSVNPIEQSNDLQNPAAVVLRSGLVITEGPAVGLNDDLYQASNARLVLQRGGVTIKTVGLEAPALEVAAGGAVVAVLTEQEILVYRTGSLELLASHTVPQPEVRP